MTDHVAPELISMADIAELAGESRSTVGNWKARKPDEFPAQRGRGTRGPLYDKIEVITWLEATGRLRTHRSEEAALWRIGKVLGGAVPPEESLALLLVLIGIRALVPDRWEAIRHAPGYEARRVVESSVRDRLRHAERLFPRAVSDRALEEVIRIVDALADDRLPVVADLALEKTAESLGRRGGEFLTPPAVRKLVVELTGAADTVYNPATGAAQLLADLASRAVSAMAFVGQEVNEWTLAISQLNLELHGVKADVALGDVFTEDRYPLLRAERVVAVPPWNPRVEGLGGLRDDPRWVWGEPGPSDGNAAWIQHCLAHLADPGTAVLVLPPNAAFEAGGAGKIRQRIVKAGLLDAVIALPAGLFQTTSIASLIAVFRKGRDQQGGLPGSTLMLDLTEHAHRVTRTTVTLNDQVIEEVGEQYRSWTRGELPSVPYGAVATYEEIAANDFVIAPARYIEVATATINPIELAGERARVLEELERGFADAQALDGRVTSGSAEPTGSHVAEVRLSDLLVSGVVMARGFPTQRAREDAGVPVLSIAALRQNVPPRLFADRRDLADLELGVARPGDVLVAVEGGTVGEVFVVPDGLGEFVPSQQAVTIRTTGDQRLDPWFLAAWLSSAGQPELQRLVRGAGIQRIAFKDLGSLAVPLPPLELQQQIGGRIAELEHAVQLHRRLATQLEALRDIELSIMFTGDRPPEAEQEAGARD